MRVNGRFSRFLFGPALWGALAIGVSYGLPLLTGNSPAFSQERKVPERAKRQTPAMSQENYQLLQKAQEQAEAKLYADAFATISKLLERKGLSSYEQAMAYNFRGYLYYEQNNIAKALQEYELVLKQPDLPYSFEDAIKFTLAQLYASNDQFDRALALLNDWFQYQEDPPLTAYVLKGQIYYQEGADFEKKGNKTKAMEAYRQGIPPIEIAINKAKADPTLDVRENWYALLSALTYATGDIKRTKDILEIMIVRWPRPQYWIQLAAMYYELDQPQKQLAVMDVAYRLNYIEREPNLINIAQLYSANGAPYLTSKVLQKGFKTEATDKDGKKHPLIDPANEKTQELLAQSLLAAQEYKAAIEPMRKAAAASDKGNLYLQLGHIYSTLEDWKGAAEAMRLAIQKGVDRPEQAYLYMGQAYFNLEDFKRATEAFQLAAKNPASRKTVDSWITYIDLEQKRLKRLADAGLRH
jgi:tetratricopeptide (TPR) repeat protein